MAQLMLGSQLTDGLNAEQHAAVTQVAGPVLVIAAPGSGKTMVLTRRIAYLINEGIQPHQILAVTFTRKAAGEMGERLLALLGNKRLVDQVTLCTFNSLGLKLLEGRYQRLGFTQKPHLLLDSTQKSLIDSLRRELAAEGIKADQATRYISSQKSSLNPPRRVVSSDEAEVVLARIYERYQSRLRRQNLFDFDDQILLPLELLANDAESRSELQTRFSHLLVDEFQDTNRAQYRLIKELAAPQHNLFAVGDDAQGIYGFRAADLDNLLSFERDFPSGTRILMETNYRSTPQIVALANNLIAYNARQISKTIRAHSPPGREPILAQTLDSFEEATCVASRIVELQQAGTTFDQVAVLYRTHAQSGLLIEALTAAGIPYSVKKSDHFFKHEAISELLGYLRLTIVDHPLEAADLERLLERQGIESGTLAILRAAAERAGKSLWVVAEQADQLPLPTLAQRNGVKRVLSMVRAWRADRRPTADLLLQVLDDTRMRAKLEQQRHQDARTKLDVLSTFHEQVKRWAPKNVGEVLRRVDEQLSPPRKDPKKKAVHLLTIHSSKGLEWEAVFVVGLEEGTLPYQLAIEEGQIAEERRLCYVAITRAKRFLQVSYVRQRLRFGTRRDAIPSRFLRELRARPTVSQS